jgi:glycosyltransferase involved in cell wall biosynthesis
MPSIAVAIPAYNAARWIDETLRSVLDQTRPADEVVVVDDGSSDDTMDRARAFGGRVRVVTQQNRGAPAAYNRAFAEAESDYVAMCPADDLWDPHKLEWQAEALERDPEIDVTFARAKYFGLKTSVHPHPTEPGRQDPERFRRAMYERDLVPAPTAVVRRELHQRLGQFDESLPSEDYEFWLRALREGAVFNFDERVMASLREHGSNLSSQALPIWEMNHRLHTAYADDVGDAEFARRVIANDLRWIGRARFGLADTAGAAAAYRASFATRRSAEAAVGGVVLGSRLGHAFAALNQRRKRRR